MTNKQKEFVYDLFYHKYDMIGKFNYIKRVMASCVNLDNLHKSEEQLKVAYDWGKKMIGKWYVSISKELEGKYSTCGFIMTDGYAYKRTKEIQAQLLTEYSTLLKKLV